MPQAPLHLRSMGELLIRFERLRNAPRQDSKQVNTFQVAQSRLATQVSRVFLTQLIIQGRNSVDRSIVSKACHVTAASLCAAIPCDDALEQSVMLSSRANKQGECMHRWFCTGSGDVCAMGEGGTVERTAGCPCCAAASTAATSSPPARPVTCQIGFKKSQLYASSGTCLDGYAATTSVNQILSLPIGSDANQVLCVSAHVAAVALSSHTADYCCYRGCTVAVPTRKHWCPSESCVPSHHLYI